MEGLKDRKRSRLREATLGLLLIGAAVAASLLLAEIALRITGFQYPVLYQPDPQTGSWHRPGARGRWRAEGDAWVSINSAGMRDEEHAEGPRPEALRVAILGDSYAEALQVDLEESFFRVMARRMEQCPGHDGRPVEPLNFGMSGFGTVQQLITLRERVWRYEPDLVLLLFIPNDIRNNSRDLERDPGRPYAELVRGQLEIDRSFLESERYRSASSRWARFRASAASLSRVVQLFDETRRLRHRAARPQGLDTQDAVYGPPRTKAWGTAWRVTEAAISQIAREVQERGSRFVLGVGTFGPQVHPDPEARSGYLADSVVDDFLYPETRLRQLGRREGFQVVVLAERLRAAAQVTGECMHGFENAKPCGGHWNARGHETAGKHLAHEICNRV